jgi:rhodanese-related sulfurtransferase
MKKRKTTVVLMASLILLWIFAITVSAEDVPRITKEELKAMLGNPNLVVIDVRANVDWVGSNLKIKGAVREEPRKVNSWMDKYPKDKALVFYCS